MSVSSLIGNIVQVLIKLSIRDLELLNKLVRALLVDTEKGNLANKIRALLPTETETELTTQRKDVAEQTVEMFEVICQGAPNDYQSLEILREAYRVLGQIDSVLLTWRKIAKAYANFGARQNTVEECRRILKEFPGDQETLKLLLEAGGTVAD